MPYPGSIELLSGIKPKNNGTFPLIEAKDVYVDDDTRLDEALDGAADGINIASDVVSLTNKGTPLAGGSAVLPQYGIDYDSSTGGLTLTKDELAIPGQTAALPVYGAPQTANAAEDMTDEDSIYVYTGTTTGSLTNGNWYYYDGSDWVEGGVYNSTAFTTDKTLLVEGAAADAHITGGSIYDVKSSLFDVLAGYPELSLSFESGNLVNNGAQSPNTAYIRTPSGEARTVQAGDCIISDGTYYFRVGIYSSATLVSGNFVNWVTEDGYTKVDSLGRKYQAYVFPETYAGQYYAIVLFKDTDTDISGEVTTVSNHIKAVRVGSKKIGYERSLTSSDDLDTLFDAGVYILTSADLPAHMPDGTTTGVVLVYGPKSHVVQMIVSNSGNVISRNISTSRLGPWFRCADESEITDISEFQETSQKYIEEISNTLFNTDFELQNLELQVGGLNPKTGANSGTTDDLCKTDYSALPVYQSVLFKLDDDNYEWTIWSYGSKSIGSATHSNTFGEWRNCAAPVLALYESGDKYYRISFRRADGADLTTDTEDPTSDYSIILSKLITSYHTEADGSLNLINMTRLKGNADVTLTHNDDGSLTAETKTDGSYRAFRCLSNIQTVLKPNTVYALRCKIESMEGTSGVCYFRFRGIDDGPNRLGIGIGQMEKPGEYGAFYRATGYETRLDFFITSGTSASATVTISELMLAETDVSIPYVPYGVSASSIISATGSASDAKVWGVQNAIAHSVQYAHVRWTPIADMPSQFSSIGYKFPAGEEVMGIPYSSARGVDKLIGPQISLHTFLSAARNPRSVLYTRKLTYNNARTYYGCVCSAYIAHNFNIQVNYVTAELNRWDKLQPINIVDLMPGDVLLNGRHVRLVTFVYRDKYGRILSVGWSEAGDPVVKDTMALPWAKFLENINRGEERDIYHPYRYLNIHDVDYRREPEAVGYPDETVEEIVYPDIMSEFGDEAVLLQGESTIVNVIDDTGYDTITVKLNGVTIQTTTTLSDFTLSNLQPGLYEISMTGTGKESKTQFFVCQATCSFDNDSKILRFGSTNATPVAVYVYSLTPTNRLVELTETDLVNGYVDLSDYMITTEGEAFNYCKIAFAPNDHSDWGVATWYTDSPEALGFWTTV